MKASILIFASLATLVAAIGGLSLKSLDDNDEINRRKWFVVAPLKGSSYSLANSSRGILRLIPDQKTAH